MKKCLKSLLGITLCLVLLVTAAMPAFAALGTVKKLTYTDTTPTSVSLKWSAVSGASKYEVQQLKNNSWKKIATPSGRTYTVKGLKIGTTYSFRVRALKGSSAGAFSKTLRVSPAPATVTGLKCSAKSMTAVKLQWDKQKGVTGYRVQQYINAQWKTVVKKTTSTSVKIKNLEPGTTYKFRVCAYQKVGSKNYFGAYCTRLAVKTNAVGVATGLKAAKVTDSAVTLQWNKVSGADAYVVYSVSGNTQKQLGRPTKNAFTVKKLDGGTDYIFSVRTVIKTSERNLYSKFSDNLSVRTAPPAVTGFKASDIGSDDITLSWKKSKNAQNYRIEQLVSGKWKYIGTTNKASYTITGLQELTAYQFRVRPYHSVGGTAVYGPYSDALKVTTAKASVKGLKVAAVTDKTITLTWNVMDDAINYKVEISTDNKNFSTASAAQTSADGSVTAVVRNLAPNTAYFFRVSAIYTNGTGLPAKLSVHTAPEKVEGLRATGISGGVSLSWNGVAGADGYEVSKSANNSTWEVVGEVTDTTAAAEKLSMNINYAFRVRAFYSENGKNYYGAYSDTAFASALPPAVEGLTASGVTTTSFTVSWKRSAEAQSYKVSLSTAGGAFSELPLSISYTADTASMTIGSRTEGTEYTVQVCAVVSGVTSAPSLLTVKTVPGKVKDLSASATSGSEISLRWTAVSGAEYYEIQQKSTNGDFASVGTAKEIPHIVSGLSPSTAYTFRVRAVNTTADNAQPGEFSAEASATTTDAPATNPTSSTEPTTNQTEPTKPTTGGRTPTATKAITGIEMKINENGNSYSMTWTSVGDNAKYAVEMLNPATNKWEEVASGLWPRMFSNLQKGSMGIKCEAGSDNSTNVTWNQVSGATKYEVRTELAHDSGSWNNPVSPSGFTAVLRLAPDYKQTVRVSAIGALKFRIFALDINDENKQLAYTETTQNTYIAYDDCEYTTPKAGTLSASSSAGEKEAYTLMLIQAVNNTRYESGKVTMTEETELKANASNIDAGLLLNNLIDDDLKKSLSESESSKTTCTFNDASGTATRTVTKSDGSTSTNSYTLWRYYAITPSAGKTYLVGQHDLGAFSKAVKSVSATPGSDGSTTVTVVLNKENFSATQKATYHPGFLDSIADNTDQFSQFNSGSNATVGETTLTAKINKNYTLDSLDINSPYKMNASTTQMFTTIKVTLDGSSVYKYTFTR